ncbi:hypothetical protein ABZU45_30390 [Streptomyces avermitilis]
MINPTPTTHPAHPPGHTAYSDRSLDDDTAALAAYRITGETHS